MTNQVKPEDDTNEALIAALEGPKIHPAWGNFIEFYRPSHPSHDPEYLTTANILVILNDMVFCEGYTEIKLFNQLQEAKYKMMNIGTSHYWLLKRNSR